VQTQGKYQARIYKFSTTPIILYGYEIVSQSNGRAYTENNAIGITQEFESMA